MTAGIQKSLIAAAAAALFINQASAQTAAISDDVVKIGVLTDMSGQFSHESGEGSVTAIKMAVEDFGGKVLGKPIEVVVADHQNKPDIASATGAQMVRCREGRHDRQPDQFLDRTQRFADLRKRKTGSPSSMAPARLV